MYSVHSIIMENSAQPDEGCGGGARHPSFTVSIITSKVVVYAPAERADTHSSYFSSTFFSSVGRGSVCRGGWGGMGVEARSWYPITVLCNLINLSPNIYLELSSLLRMTKIILQISST
jgi:hypothetical protein